MKDLPTWSFKYHFTFELTHASCLNVMEMFFNNDNGTKPKEIRVYSKDELKERMLECIENIDNELVVLK